MYPVCAIPLNNDNGGGGGPGDDNGGGRHNFHSFLMIIG